MAAAGYQLFKLVYQHQADSLYSLEELLGRQAEVTITIPERGVVQVSCEFHSQRLSKEPSLRSQKTKVHD